MPTNLLLKSHVIHSKQYRSPCRVLLGLHGCMVIALKGFFLNNLCCLECMAVCRLYIGPIYTPIKINNPPLSIYFSYYNVRPALCQVLNLKNYIVCVQNNFKIHCLSRPTKLPYLKLFLVAGILYFLTESQYSLSRSLGGAFRS